MGVTGRKPFQVEILVKRGIFPEDWKSVVMELGKNGKNRIHFMNALNISRNAFNNLLERSKDFKETIDQALQLSEQWFINKALENYDEKYGRDLNSNFFKYYLQNVYRDSGWKDQTDITTDGKAITTDNAIQVEIINPNPKKEDDNKEDEKEH